MGVETERPFSLGGALSALEPWEVMRLAVAAYYVDGLAEFRTSRLPDGAPPKWWPGRGRAGWESVMLSAQERRIAELAAAGHSNRQIAAQLYLSPRTVGAHLYRIFPKLGVTSRAGLGRALASLGPEPADKV